jgi:hypothetical protein
MPAPINTGKVTDRRKIAFRSPDELLADVDRIVAADRAGKLRRTGNWTSGQILGHLASWSSYPYDGYPPDLRPPWFIKAILRLRKNAFLRGQLPAGVHIPKIEGGTKGAEACALDEGHTRFRRAWDRLRAGPPTQPNIIFGPLTHEQWIGLNLRHAELHLSFLHPG